MTEVHRVATDRAPRVGSGNDVAKSLGVSPDSTLVFVTGKSEGSTSGNDYATVAYDASTGHKVWARRYRGPGNADDQANALAVSPDGSRVFVTGSSTGSTSGFDYTTVAYDASTGAKLWVTRGPAGLAFALAVSPDGGKVFVTGIARHSPPTRQSRKARGLRTGNRPWRSGWGLRPWWLGEETT